MSENVVEFVQALGEAGVAALTDVKSFIRADEILDIDMTPLVRTGPAFTAQVMGTDVWVVRFELVVDEGKTVADRLNVHCTCPVPRMWCKHAVAVALQMMRHPEWPLTAKLVGEAEEEYEFDSTRRYDDVVVDTKDVVTSTLETMSKRDLVDVINALRHENPLAEPTVTKYVLPFSSQPLPAMEAVQDEMKFAKFLFDVAYTEEKVEEAAHNLEYAGNVILSHADATDFQNDKLKLLCALESLIFDAIAWTHHITYPVDSVVVALEKLYQHHVLIAHDTQPPTQLLVDWIVDVFLAPGGYLRPHLADYAKLLEDEDLDVIITKAHECAPRHPENVLPLEIDVALLRNNMHEVKRLCGEYGNYDALLFFYQRNGMDLGAEKLVAAALDSADPVELTPDLLYASAAKYFGDEGTRMYHRYWFKKDASIENFLDYIRLPDMDFADAMLLLQSMDESFDTDYLLVAAAYFKLFDVGFTLITTATPSIGMAAHFAEHVGLAHDPEWAFGVIFAHIREQMSQALSQENMAATRATVNWLMGRMMALKKTAQEATGSLDSDVEWGLQVGALKSEFGSHPVVKEVFAEWGL